MQDQMLEYEWTLELRDCKKGRKIFHFIKAKSDEESKIKANEFLNKHRKIITAILRMPEQVSESELKNFTEETGAKVLYGN